MAIGQSKEHGMLDMYITGSHYSTQAGNQTNLGEVVQGGFTATGEYAEKYAGGDGTFGAGASMAHGNYDVFGKITEQPEHPTFFD